MAYLLQDHSLLPSRASSRAPAQPRGPGIFSSFMAALHGGADIRASSATAPPPPSSPSSSSKGSLSASPLSSTAASNVREQHPELKNREEHRPSSSSSSSYLGVRALHTHEDAAMFRRATDFTDVMEILQSPIETAPPSSSPSSSTMNHHDHDKKKNGALRFRLVAAEEETGVKVYSAPVPDFPLHLMRATVVMPCAASDVLHYMDNEIRPQWDTHIRRSALLRELHDDSGVADEKIKENNHNHNHNKKRVKSDGGRPFWQRDLTSALTARVVPPPTSPSSIPRTADPLSLSSLSSSSSPSLLLSSRTAPTPAPPPFAYARGQRRVALHYLEVKSPVPFIQDRDFELVVCEEVLKDGTARLKSFSTTLGYAVPLDPKQARYVRALVLLSGVVATPLSSFPPAVQETLLPPGLQSLRRADAKRDFCVMEYVGLVHPMGMLPAVLVNMVISAQLSSLQKMQHFVAQHPLRKPATTTLLLSASSSAVVKMEKTEEEEDEKRSPLQQWLRKQRVRWSAKL